MSVTDKIWSIWRIFLVTLICLIVRINVSEAEGRIGCLFAESLCSEHEEWCHDDYAFGKCLPEYGLVPEDLLREALSEEQTSFLATMLEELQGAGLDWEHPFVQCRMQGALYSIRNQSPMPNNLCASLAPDPEILGPQSPLAFVRFTPPNDDFADEVYYPPEAKKAFDDRLYLGNNDDFDPEDNDVRQYIEEHDPENYGRIRVPKYPSNTEVQSSFEERQEQLSNLIENLNKAKKEKSVTAFREMSREQHIPIRETSEFYEPVDVTDNNMFNLQRRHNTNRAFTNKPVIANAEHVDYMKNNVLPPSAESGVYTEGGLVYVPEGEESKLELNTDARNLLRDIMGFTRHERLDVKKPGPPASPPQPHLKPNETPILEELSMVHAAQLEQPQHQQPMYNKEILPEHLRPSTISTETETQKVKKLITDHQDDEDHAPHSVDTEYTHVILKNPIDSWQSGSRIVNAIGEMLNLKLTNTRVDRHEVSFRVEPNQEKKTATDVAKYINDTRFKNNLSRRLGIIVIRAGVGDKTKELNSSVHAEKVDENADQTDFTYIIAYLLAGAGAASIIVFGMILVLIKRHDKKRDKLGGLQSGIVGTETCTKDYQELCRARMAGKGNSTESNTSARIASLTKEAEARPPSSRSSTSSWSEEPTLTNMDISTGHMVLSYMEDHLKNKGRLHREWEALCRYEAEPSARDAALQPQCAPLNRSGAPLPYDHSRVVLNHLSNAEGLDYINASTITDHDPRAPAYVAASGPIPSTLAHFWQMIWEQGAVVIVALCRLQENGQVSCARYWPEEGSDVYHIYEVHLVSEHIWCDDYLVRSFYLKNLRTGETRTVTQFHFLSWPQSGVPASAKALLEFRRKVNKSYRGRSCPIVVHSGNGAGRTGAYILLDLVLARMNKGAREIDIAATLEHLRDQRAGLVETRLQFEFVLMAVAEEVHAILKALPANTQQSTEKRDLEKEIKEKGEDESNNNQNNKPKEK